MPIALDVLEPGKSHGGSQGQSKLQWCKTVVVAKETQSKEMSRSSRFQQVLVDGILLRVGVVEVAVASEASSA